MKEITVCIVDDVNELRHALEEIVSSADGYKCIGTMSNTTEALTRIPLLKPDVVLMDINLGESESGIDLVRELKPIMPATNFMMCTVYEDDENLKTIRKRTITVKKGDVLPVSLKGKTGQAMIISPTTH